VALRGRSLPLANAMRPRHTTKRVISGLGLIAVAACLWFFLAPTALGGRTSYIVTHGVSMQPRFHSGDLVLVRSQSSYRVGEIVAYHSNVFHTVVLHRIIGRVGDRYVFKGDNNNFVDFEHPAASQLMGAVWLHVAGVGSELQSIRSPALVGALIALAALLFAGTAFARRRRLRGRARRAGRTGRSGATRPAPATPTASAGPAAQSAPLVPVLACGLAALLPFALLALIAFTQPASSVRASTVPYRQVGRLSYSAQATPGPTYANDRAVTGEPLFTQVISNVRLRYDYRFHSTTSHALSGTAAMDALVTSTSGWQTTLALAEPQRFHGDHGVLFASLDLSSLLGLVRSVEKATDVGGAYTLALLPRVRVSGQLGERPLHATFSPQIHFSLNQDEVQPVAAGGGGAVTGPSAAALFLSSSAGSATVRRDQPQYLALGAAQLAVGTARAIALVGIVLDVLLTLAVLAMVRPRRRDETQVILSRYGRMIVPVARVWQLPGVPVIEVADIEALVRIAEHYERSILHETEDGGGAFWVSDESGQFRYTPAPGGLESPEARVQPAPPPQPSAAVYADADPAASPNGTPNGTPNGSVGKLDDRDETLAYGEQPAAEATYAAESLEWADTAVNATVNGGDEDWRAACEAAGVVLDAPLFP